MTYRDPYPDETRRLRRVLRWVGTLLGVCAVVVTLVVLGDDDDDDDDDDDRDDGLRAGPTTSQPA